MNAGKSTALLQSNHNYSESNLKTLLFIPKDLEIGRAHVRTPVTSQSRMPSSA